MNVTKENKLLFIILNLELYDRLIKFFQDFRFLYNEQICKNQLVPFQRNLEYFFFLILMLPTIIIPNFLLVIYQYK
jgi:hypothetical protein